MARRVGRADDSLAGGVCQDAFALTSIKGFRGCVGPFSLSGREDAIRPNRMGSAPGQR